MTIVHWALIAMVAVVLGIAWSAIRRGRTKAALEASPAEGSDVPACISCGEPAVLQEPFILPSRGAFDWPVVGDILYAMKLQPTVRYELVLVRDAEKAVPMTRCWFCHRIARGRAEMFLARQASKRAESAVNEAREVIEFQSHGLAKEVFEDTLVVREQRAPASRKLRSLSSQQSPARTNGTVG